MYNTSKEYHKIKKSNENKLIEIFCKLVNTQILKLRFTIKI